MKTFICRPGHCLLVLATILAAGCSLGPGIDLDNQLGSSKWYGERVVSGPHQAELMIVPITPDVVARQRREKRASVTKELTGAAARQHEQYTYRVGARDVLNIIVWDHPELSIFGGNTGGSRNRNFGGANGASGGGVNGGGDYEFDDDNTSRGIGYTVTTEGTIFFPYVGTINVVDKSVEQIRLKITENLSKYIEDPQVHVEVIRFRNRRYYITGQAQNIGVFSIGDVPVTILDAVTRAGSNSEAGTPEVIYLTRRGKRVEIDLRGLTDGTGLHQNLLLEADDVLYFPDDHERKLMIAGSVGEQTVLTMRNRRFTLAEALLTVGGLNRAEADASGVYVIRALERVDRNGKEYKVPVVFNLDASVADAFVLAEQFVMKPRDVVFVATNDLVRFRRVFSLLLPNITSFIGLERTVDGSY